MIVPLLALLAMALPQKPDNVLKNGNFESGLSGWNSEGAVSTRAENSSSTSHSLRLGQGRGVVSQRYNVPGLRILWFGATVKTVAGSGQGNIRLQCFDADDRVLMDLTSDPDPKTNTAAIYLKTHEQTQYVVASIEKRSDAGEIVADGARLTDDDRKRVIRKSEVDLDAATRPFWSGNRVEDESVLLLSTGGGPPSGKLLFPPTRIVSVRDATLRKTYRLGKDYTLDDNLISAVSGSAIPTFSDTAFAKGEFPWTPLEGRHVFVTYEHGGRWRGPRPEFAGDRLPLSLERLKAKRSMRIVAYGDSITLGMSASSFRNVSPYLPPWPTLFARSLSKAYGHSKIEMVNMGLGGMNSYWARDNAKDAVASHDPDLVLIAFGMNDFWSLTPEEFRRNIEATIATIRTERPECEFLLVSSMKFDPAYTADPTYVGNMNGYAEELRGLVGPGVALLDMTALSSSLYEAKSAKDLGTDPMHPNDFLNRVYAQAAAALLLPPPPNR